MADPPRGARPDLVRSRCGPAAAQPLRRSGGRVRRLLLGAELEGAFVETMVRGSARLLLSLAELWERAASAVPLVRDLRLARLHSDGLVKLSLPASVPHALPYDECHALARAVWNHPTAVDGIEYRSRWDDSRLCVALFDRAADGVGSHQTEPLGSTSLLRSILRHYTIGVV